MRLCAQKSLTGNRDELAEKLSEASTLKSDIDRRGELISDTLSSCLSADEFVEYQHLMVDKARVRLQRQELDDWQRLADQLLKQLSSVDVDDSVQEDPNMSHC